MSDMVQDVARRKPPFARAVLCVLLALLSAPLFWSGAVALQRGDSDNKGSRELTDAIFILQYLFNGGKAPLCTPIADADANGRLELTDAIFLLSHLFLGGREPPPLTAADLAACGAGPDPAAVARGWKEYESSDKDGNSFSCATCHTMAPDSTAEVIRSGYTLLDSLVRPSYKGGQRANFLGAVNVCRKDWMAVFDFDLNDYVPWKETDARFQDLVAFIQSLSTAESSPALVYEIVAPAKTGPSTGNATEGCKLFNRSCRACHGMGARGEVLGPTLIDVAPLCLDKPDLCLDFACKPTQKCLDNPDYLRTQIRLSGPIVSDPVYHAPPGFEFTGTTMPFWTKDKLTDSQVEDLVAFISAAREAARNGQTLDCGTDPSPDGNVVRRGTLGNATHDVAGTVEELDNKKLRFTNFSYNGGGIEVRVWLSKASDATSGLAVGPDIFGRSFNNETFVVELPAQVTSASYDTVSIRCVLGSQDLGKATLAAP